MDHGLPNLRLPILSSFEPIGVRLVIHESLVDLLLRIQDKGPVLDDLLV